MFESLSFPILIGIFIAAAVVILFAGVKLADSTDVLQHHFGLGEALGGMILLAVATNLPEIAVTVTAALIGQLEVAVGNILGGIAIQTVVLVVIDWFTKEPRPLTSLVASLLPVLEGGLVIAVLIIAVMGKQVSPSLALGGLGPGEVAIAALWLIGLWLIGKGRKGLPWKLGNGEVEQDDEGQGDGRQNGGQMGGKKVPSTGKAALIFGAAAVATLVAGFVIEQSGEGIAKQIGVTGAAFGATVLAATTALPELATGLEAIKIKQTPLAISDIFGGNAFLPVLFLLAGLLSGRPVLPLAKPSDIYLTGLGVLLTAVYIWGLVFRAEGRFFRMGIDSVVVLVLYILGIAGLFAVAGG